MTSACGRLCLAGGGVLGGGEGLPERVPAAEGGGPGGGAVREPGQRSGEGSLPARCPPGPFATAASSYWRPVREWHTEDKSSALPQGGRVTGACGEPPGGPVNERFLKK